MLVIDAALSDKDVLKPLQKDETGFWLRHLCSDAYCNPYFALSEYQQEQTPSLLRRFLRLPEFKTKASRMGKVVRVSLANIKYYQFGDQKLHVLAWLKK